MQFTPVLNLFALRIPLKNNYYKTIVINNKKGERAFTLSPYKLFDFSDHKLANQIAHGGGIVNRYAADKAG